MKKTIKELSSHDLICIHWAEALDVAYRLMANNDIRHLPVVDGAGSIVGLISERDFQRAMYIDQPDFVSGKAPQAEFDPNAKVRDFMSWPVESISENDSIDAAARIMIEKKISSLLVTRGNSISGIVTSNDMLRALLGNQNDNHDKDRTGLVKQLVVELKSKAKSALYNSPIGSIAQALSNAGI